MTASKRVGAALWLTGLPGSGKSTIARAVHESLKARGVRSVLLSMDERRGEWFPTPTYSDAERDEAYRMLAAEAAELAGRGLLVLVDATAHKQAMRDYARRLIPRFAEVLVLCDLATAMEREAGRPGGTVMAGLYAKARERKATGREFPGLGPVIGVDEPYERSPATELVVDTALLSVEEARDAVLAFIGSWLS